MADNSSDEESIVTLHYSDSDSYVPSEPSSILSDSSSSNTDSDTDEVEESQLDYEAQFEEVETSDELEIDLEIDVLSVSNAGSGSESVPTMELRESDADNDSLSYVPEIGESSDNDDDLDERRPVSPEVISASDEESSSASRLDLNDQAEIVQDQLRLFPQVATVEVTIGDPERNGVTSSVQPQGGEIDNIYETNGIIVIEDSLKPAGSSTSNKSQGEKRPFDDSFVDDGMTCSICLDSFTNSGHHRLVSLRCGHLFGHSCVERWLKVGCNSGAKRCPTCNKKAALKDIRVLYARKLVAIDTSELDKFKEELKQALLNKNMLDLEIQVCRINQDMLKKELETLKKELEIARKKAAASIPDEVIQSQTINKEPLGFELRLLKTVDISSVGGCRVMTWDNHMNIVVSTQSKNINNLFPGYGIAKLDALEFRPVQMIPLHQKMIRDLAFHRVEKDQLLSVSLDGTAKLLDIRCNSGLNTYRESTPLWACCWDANNTNLFYTGGQSGKVSQFDTRNILESVNAWAAVGDPTAIVSLAGVPGACHSNFRQAGFLSCRLNSMWAYEQEDAAKWMEPRSLPISGPFMSMSYNEDTQLILTTSRPSTRCTYSRLTLNQISGNFRSCNLIHTICGSSSTRLMSRSCFLSPPSTNRHYVAAYNESASKIEMFDSASGQPTCSAFLNENIVDLCPVYVNGSCVLSALTGNKLMVYKFISL